MTKGLSGAALFAPDDFAGRPYEGGLNQMGHVVAGAALAAFLPLAVALLAILAWEGWQFWKRGATKKDFRIDVVFWVSGAAPWSYAIGAGLVTGYAVYAPFFPVIAFSLEYLRISRAVPKA